MTELICIVCPKGCHLNVDENNGYKVTGYSCSRGEVYGKNELMNPTRVVTSTICIEGAEIPRMPVKTNGAIPKQKIFDLMNSLNNLNVKAPVLCGQVVVENILNTGIDLVATRTLMKIN